jgi:hypothetical protein
MSFLIPALRHPYRALTHSSAVAHTELKPASRTQVSPPAQAHTGRLRPRTPTRGALFAGGTAGNELLTAVTGAVLIVALAVVGVTILRLQPLLSVHMFVGLLLIGPVALKLASTGYRFARYYTGNSRYREVGPPIAPLRLIAPILVISTLVVFASGVALLLAGPGSRATLLPIHKLSFIVWIAFTALHVLGHLPAVGQALRADYAPALARTDHVPGRSGRALSLAGTLVLGTVLAILLVPEFAPWLHAQPLHLLRHR